MVTHLVAIIIRIPLIGLTFIIAALRLALAFIVEVEAIMVVVEATIVVVEEGTMVVVEATTMDTEAVIGVDMDTVVTVKSAS